MKIQSIIKNSTLFILAVVLSFVLFSFLPIIHLYFNDQSESEKEKQKPTTTIVLHQQKKVENRSQPKPQMRSAQSQGDRSQSRQTLDIKFTPDLSVGSGSGVAVESQNLENMVFEEGEVDEKPVPVSRVAIEYPARAREMNYEGTVTFILLIDRTGKVSSVEFMRVPHVMFKKTVEDAVKKWRFKPARKKGIPVSLRMKQEIEFSLDK